MMSVDPVVEVIEVNSCGWRLRDRSRQESDSRGLLGFVETDSNGFDVVWLTPCVDREHFTTFDAAIQAAALHCPKG
jgi:hypothetical protein